MSTPEYHDEIWDDIPITAFMALGRRGRESISLQECMVPGCNNITAEKLHPLEKREETVENTENNSKVHTIKVKIYCETCEKSFHLNFKQTHDLDKDHSDPRGNIVLEEVYASDENDEENYGHIGYVQSR